MSATKDKDPGSTLDTVLKRNHISADTVIWGTITSSENSPCRVLSLSRLFPAANWTQQFLSGPEEPEELFFLDTNAALEERWTWALTSFDVESITTYWEASECCCSCRRCFPCPTCQRCFLPASPFCPCGWSFDGGASDAGSSWARAHQCKTYGDLQKSKTADELTDTAHAGKLARPAQRTPSNSGWCVGKPTKCII